MLKPMSLAKEGYNMRCYVVEVTIGTKIENGWVFDVGKALEKGKGGSLNSPPGDPPLEGELIGYW